jgi:hypothetical protein
MMQSVSRPPPREAPTPLSVSLRTAEVLALGFSSKAPPAHFSQLPLRFPIMRALAKNPDTLAFVFFAALFATVIAHVGR